MRNIYSGTAPRSASNYRQADLQKSCSTTTEVPVRNEDLPQVKNNISLQAVQIGVKTAMTATKNGRELTVY